jgi:acid phosphatase type 7
MRHPTRPQGSDSSGLRTPGPLVSSEPTAGPAVLVGAGDITSCATERDEATAKLLDSIGGTVFTLGDNAYSTGSATEYTNCYEPTWGRHKARTRPTPGDRDYQTTGATGYFDYFGAAAGDEAKGYYRWALGAWTVFVLNSGAINYTRDTGLRPELPDDCWPVSCGAGSEQEQWLIAELGALPAASCVLAYWHHPRFSSGFSGRHQPHPETEPLFDALQNHDADLILAGHSHNYERFKPLSPGGLTQFVVGTGGRSLHVPGPQLTTSEILRADVFGVLELTLAPTGWSSRFVAESGETLDSAAGGC